MAYRYFITNFWSEPDIMRLSINEKLIFIYLWTNSRSNQAGLYSISLDTISYETSIEKENVKTTLEKLEKEGKIKRDGDWIWVINFIKHQANRSETVLKNIAMDLMKIESNLVQELLKKYNTLSIPYAYPIGGVGYESKVIRKVLRNKESKGIRKVIRNKESKEIKIISIKSLIDYYYNKYLEIKKIKLVFKPSIAIRWTKTLKLLSKNYSEEIIKSAMIGFLRDEDRWLIKQVYPPEEFEKWIQSKHYKIKKAEERNIIEQGKKADIEQKERADEAQRSRQ